MFMLKKPYAITAEESRLIMVIRQVRYRIIDTGVLEHDFKYFNIEREAAHHWEILKRLVSIEFHKRNLLVDGDKAGKKMKELCKDTVFADAVCISDLSTERKKFSEIEHLFSEEDKNKFGIEHKSASQSSLMKATCTLDDFTQETVENFKALFALLLD